MPVTVCTPLCGVSLCVCGVSGTHEEGWRDAQEEDRAQPGEVGEL